jgi:hypothetical protein
VIGVTMDIEAVKAEAIKIYESTMCATGCCGNFDEAIKYIFTIITEDVEFKLMYGMNNSDKGVIK